MTKTAEKLRGAANENGDIELMASCLLFQIQHQFHWVVLQRISILNKILSNIQMIKRY